MLNLHPRALYATAFLVVMLAAAPLQTRGAEHPQLDRPTSSSGDASGALQEIATLFNDGQYGLVVAKVDQFMSAHTTTLENIAALFFKAESQYQLGDGGAAIQTYQSALGSGEALTNNVTQRRFVPVYFRLAQILRQQRRLDAALTQVEAGLRLAPQYVEGQIFLGQLLTESGDRARALEHFRNQLTSSLPVAEERAVIGIKADRLATGHPGTSIAPPDFSSAPIYQGLSVGIVAVNHVPAEVVLSDICVILESSWLIHCVVLPPLTIPDAAILNEKRGQYDADLMLKEVERRMLRDARRPSHILAITGRDIFAPTTGFVFSWQRPNEAEAVGVLSVSRFATGIPDYYEPDIMATRRVALQALSTTGSMFGFTRPTDPTCPLAYPESFREFQHKRLRLCSSDEQQRDQLLRRKGGTPDLFGRVRSDVIASVYQKYFIE